MLSARDPIAIYRALICFKETFSQYKEARIIYVVQAFSTQCKFDDTSQGRKYDLLTISFSPDNTTLYPVTFAKINCGRGLAKDFIRLQDSHIRSYKENIFLMMQQVADFDRNLFSLFPLSCLPNWLRHGGAKEIAVW